MRQHELIIQRQYMRIVYTYPIEKFYLKINEMVQYDTEFKTIIGDNLIYTVQIYWYRSNSCAECRCQF